MAGHFNGLAAQVKLGLLPTPNLCSVGFSIQEEVMDFARSVPQGAHCHKDVIYLHLLTRSAEANKGLMVL